MHEGLAARQTTGAELARPYFLALQAEVYGKVGQSEHALALLAEALTTVRTSGERRLEAELYRLKGELALQSRVVRLMSGTSTPQPPTPNTLAQAEECFQQALDVSRKQQAKSFELRAAMSLARLWQRQGKRQEAYDLLAPIYGWFTEGFDTADLKDAKILLQERA